MRPLLIWTMAGAVLAACGDGKKGSAAHAAGGAMAGAAGDSENAGESGNGGTSGSDDETTCASFVRQLTDCGVLTGTRLAGCDDGEPLLACAADCVRNASCEALEAMYCSGSYNELAACLDACQTSLPLPEFTCGDGTRIPARWTCDGASDCEDESDEDCPAGTFACENGLEIPLGWRCDGVSDCSSSEDELDCTGEPAFTCSDGDNVPASRACDGVADCAGGDDELDCATLVCR